MILYAIYLFLLTMTYCSNISFALFTLSPNSSNSSSNTEDNKATNDLPNEYRHQAIQSYRNVIGPMHLPQNAETIPRPYRLDDSNCDCIYYPVGASLDCNPVQPIRPTASLPKSNFTLKSVTLNSCIFTTNHFMISFVNLTEIDYLYLYDINREDYLVFDKKSFSSVKINNLSIAYSDASQRPKLIIYSEAFSTSSIVSSLRKIECVSCEFATIKNVFYQLDALETIELTNIRQFFWYDFKQEIKDLRNLRNIKIHTEYSESSNYFNVLSCKDILPQWTVNFDLIQTCSCNFIELLQAVYYDGSYFICKNIGGKLSFDNTTCNFQGNKIQTANGTDFFCKQCSSSQCSPHLECTETRYSSASCIPSSSAYNFSVNNQIPMTPYTKLFHFQQMQQYLSLSPNKTIQPENFYSIATNLIDSNRNASDSSSNTTHMFHEIFSQIIDKPWAPEVFTAVLVQPDTTVSSLDPPSETPSTLSSSTKIWQELILSLDKSVKNINDNITEFVYQSKSISTMSLYFSIEEQPKETLGWKITKDNRITTNMTDIKSFNNNVTSTVFLKFSTNQSFEFNCNMLNPYNDCTNRYSIISIKAQKLFYKTDRIPQHDVISIVAPTQKQTVTFHFLKTISSNDIFNYTVNTSNLGKVDSFYNEIDSMISEGTCMYLNTTSMIWETSGCLTDRKSSNSSFVNCTCEHLTMFTVFFSLTCTVPSLPLEILTWIGCILSLISLSITLMMFVFMSLYRQTKYSIHAVSSSTSSTSQEHRRRTMNKSPHLSIVKSMLLILCILLILMNIFIFILTFVKPGRNLICKILSALLYYFTLAAFIWKLLFALQQSLFLTNIYKIQWTDQTLFTMYFILTFATPVFPLLIMFIKYEDATFISSACNYCWLSREFLLYGLIIPILVIICFNIMFYLYTMIYLCIRNREQVGLRSTKSDQSRYIQNVKIGLFFAIIMGFSWILGFLVLIPNSIIQFVGNILFCTANTFQGFAFSIMVFFMIERKSFIYSCRWLRRREKGKKIISYLPSIIPQESLPTSNDNDTIKIKTRFNTSIYTTSTTSNGDNNTLEIYDHYRNRKLLTEKEIDENEYMYNLPIL